MKTKKFFLKRWSQAYRLLILALIAEIILFWILTEVYGNGIGQTL